MDWLYDLAQPFVWHPARAFLVALGWLAATLLVPKAARRPLLVVAVGWGIFAVLELEAWRERANIRLDLPVTWLALCALTVTSLALALKRILARRVPPWGSRLTSGSSGPRPRIR